MQILKNLDKYADPEQGEEINAFLSSEIFEEEIISEFINKFTNWYEQEFSNRLNYKKFQNDEPLIKDKEIIMKYKTKNIKCIAVTNDRKHLIYPLSNFDIRIWNLEQNNAVSALQGHNDSIVSLKVSNNDEYLVSASGDKTVRVWNLQNKQQIAVLTHSSPINAAIISFDNRYILSNDYNILKIWTLDNKKQVTLPKGHTRYINTIAITSNNQDIVSGSYDCTIIIWDFKNECKKGVLLGHNGSVDSIVITSDNIHIVSASFDKTVRVWNLKDRVQVAKLEGHNALTPQTL